MKLCQMRSQPTCKQSDEMKQCKLTWKTYILIELVPDMPLVMLITNFVVSCKPWDTYSHQDRRMFSYPSNSGPFVPTDITYNIFFTVELFPNPEYRMDPYLTVANQYIYSYMIDQHVHMPVNSIILFVTIFVYCVGNFHHLTFIS